MGQTNFEKHSKNCTGMKGKPYRCGKCGATFASQDGRKKHAQEM